MLAMRLAIPSIKSCPIRSRDKKPEMLGMLAMRPPTPRPLWREALCRAGASKKPGLVNKKNTSTRGTLDEVKPCPFLVGRSLLLGPPLSVGRVYEFRVNIT